MRVSLDFHLMTLLALFLGFDIPTNNGYFSINPNCNKCSDCIIVSNLIENDSVFNILLASYLYDALIGGYACPLLSEENINNLYKRESFHRTIILFYTDSSLNKLSVYEDIREWRARYIELLYGISDLAILHILANDLLRYNNFDGAIALWGNANLSELTNLDEYLESVDQNNFFVCAELAAFFDVSNHHLKKNEYMLKASNFIEFTKEYKSLVELMNSKENYDYLEFKEAIFGGI